MEIVIHNIEDKKVIVDLKGRLDTLNAAEAEIKFLPLMESEELNVILDCTDFDYISSSGLRLFLTLQKKIVANKGSLTIVNLNENIMDVFEMIGFSKIFDIVKKEEKSEEDITTQEEIKEEQ